MTTEVRVILSGAIECGRAPLPRCGSDLVRWSVVSGMPEHTIAANDDESQTDNDVQNVIDASPKKILLRGQIHKTRRGLIEINQAKPQVEQGSMSPQKKDQAQTAEEDMKDVVWRGAAGESLLLRY